MNARTATILDPRNASAYTRDHLEESMMAIVGRGAANPRKFRDWLKSLTLEELTERFREVVDV